MLVTKFGGTDKAGVALKSTKGWDEGGNGTNSSGFNALPGGQRRPDGSGNVLMASLGYWWTSTPTGEKGNQKCSVSMPMFLPDSRFVASGIDLRKKKFAQSNNCTILQSNSCI